MPSLGTTVSLVDANGRNSPTVNLTGFTANQMLDKGNSFFKRTEFAFTGQVTLTTGGTNGSAGGIKLCDFPVGAVQAMGGVANLTITTATNTGFAFASAAVLASVGTIAPVTATNDGNSAVLSGTEANFIQSTSFTMSGGTKNSNMISTTIAPTTIDGSTTNAAAYLNLAVAAATGGALVTVSGVVKIDWVHIGNPTTTIALA